MRIAIVGFGSMGRRHWTNLSRIVPDASFIFLRRSGMLPPEAVEGIAVSGIEDVVEFKPDAAFVCSPASEHIAQATVLAEAGAHLFIEKPVSVDRCGLEPLIRICRERKLVSMVGYCLRFHPPLRRLKEALRIGEIGRVLSMRAEVGQYLPEWRPGTDYRTSVSADPKLGGGALLELSHEIDLIRFLCGEPVSVFASVRNTGALGLNVEDLAEITLEMHGGAIAQVHLDMVRRDRSRSVEIIGEKGTLRYVWGTPEPEVYLPKAGVRQALAMSDDYDPGRMYADEVVHFLECVNRGIPCECSLEEGDGTLRVVEAARRSSVERKVVEI